MSAAPHGMANGSDSAANAPQQQQQQQQQSQGRQNMRAVPSPSHPSSSPLLPQSNNLASPPPAVLVNGDASSSSAAPMDVVTRSPTTDARSMPDAAAAGLTLELGGHANGAPAAAATAAANGTGHAPTLPPIHDLSALPAAERAYCTPLLHESALRHSRHQHRESIAALDRILAVAPSFVPAWTSKGVAYKHMKDNVSAVQCFQRALALDPTDWSAHDHLGLIFKETELFEKAMEQYRLAILYGPKGCVASEHLAVVLTDFGTRLKLAGSTEKAVQSYKEALQVHPSYWPAWFNLGVVASERREFDLAMQHYQMAVAQNPTYVEALCNIGVIYKNSGELRLSIEYYERALRANPNFAIANSNLAVACTDMGTQVKNDHKLEEGIAYYKRALHHHSRYPAAWYNLGVAYAEQCRFDDAKVCYEMATLFDSKCAEAYNNLGVIYKDRGNLDQAIHYYNAALAANPKFSQTMNNLGVIYTMLGKLDEAHEYCSRAIQTNPLYAEAFNNLGVLKRDEGCISEAIVSYEACLRIDPLSRNAGQNRLLAMNSLSRPDQSEAERAEMVWQAHRSWGQHFQALYDKDKFTQWDYANHGSDTSAEPAASAAASSSSSSSASAASSSSALVSSIPASVSLRRPLRIGYLSADFFTHSVSYFIEAPLAFADASRTHVTCYSNVARRDKKTQHLQTLAHAWRPVHELSAKQVAEMIRADRIDILVELTGHTAGNRLDVMALRPAPVQVTWCGYPNSTGLPTIDYRLTDSIVDPLDTKQQYSEELVRLAGPFLCYTPPAEAPPVSPTPALTKGYITFGSFNNLAKVNDSVLSAWCAILHRVPHSRMLIKCKPFASPTVCGKMWSRFADRGIDSDRVDLVSLLPTTSEHLDSYSNVDLAVDTFPYAGTTTTCEALYCGVPVVTFQRADFPNHAHNVGATLLSRIKGMEGLIAKNEEEYVSIAVSLAGDIPALQRLRSNLRPAMLSSSVCDGRTFVENLTHVYETLWERYCRGDKPKPSNNQQQQQQQQPRTE